jgi:hypothetical protein
MNEREPSEKPKDELLDGTPQTPSTSDKVSRVGNLVLGSIVFTIGAIALFALFAPLLSPGYPATRSEQLETERRMAAIEQAELEFADNAQAHARK